MQQLQHWRFDLDIIAPEQRLAEAAYHRGPGPDDVPRLRTDDQIDIALAYPGLLAERSVRDR
jgi:hypothetical protein